MGAILEHAIDALRKHDAGKKVIGVLGKRYVAGHSLEEGLQSAVDSWQRHGRKSTIDILGESSTSVEEADRYLQAYHVLHGRIAALPAEFRENKVISLSLKPSAICVVKDGRFDSRTTLVTRLHSVVRPGAEDDVYDTLDMEDSMLTDATLRAARFTWRCAYPNFGTVLQTRLDRTQQDIRDIFSEKYPILPEQVRIRLVIGIYKEPDRIATADNGLAKSRLVARARELFERGAYVQIGTHDGGTAERVMDEVVIPCNIPPSRVEFQFLKGVPAAYSIEKALKDAGYSVRHYMPVEIKKGDGIPYMGRRLKEAGARMIWYGAKNIVQDIPHMIGLNGNSR